jgi:hypothetical protein
VARRDHSQVGLSPSVSVRPFRALLHAARAVARTPRPSPKALRPPKAIQWRPISPASRPPPSLLHRIPCGRLSTPAVRPLYRTPCAITSQAIRATQTEHSTGRLLCLRPHLVGNPLRTRIPNGELTTRWSRQPLWSLALQSKARAQPASHRPRGSMLRGMRLQLSSTVRSPRQADRTRPRAVQGHPPSRLSAVAISAELWTIASFRRAASSR